MDAESKRRGAPEPQDPRPAVFAAGAVPVPNWFFDQLLPRVSQRHFAVLLVVWRNTIGRRRRRNHIALSQIRRGARVSKDTARRALRFWEQAGLLRRTGRCGLRGTHEWEALPEAGSQQVVARLVAAGQPLARTNGPAARGGKARPSPGQPAATLQIDGKIETDKGAPPSSAPVHSFDHLSDAQLASNIKRVQSELAARSLPPGEVERMQIAIAAAQLEQARRRDAARPAVCASSSD